VRHRLRNGSGRLSSRGADYLAYALLDAAVDAFFPVMETCGERVEDLETDVVTKRDIDQIARIHDLKRDLLTARRAVWPQREMLNAIIRDETRLVSADTKVFLRDCYDHTVQLIDMIETYREIASGLVDIQLASQSNRMNEIMKILTIIATIFIPLSFIVGVYGMNFDTASPWNMPELKWRYGYPAVWILMIAIAVGLLVWFRRKGWIGNPRK
jgi:magnesium transporter